jgi:hypothetical protein
MAVPEPIFELTNLKKLKFSVKSGIHCVFSPKIGHLHQLQELEIVGTFDHYQPYEIGEISALEKVN